MISYGHTDIAGNVGIEPTRTVNVVDTTAPTASISYSTLLTTSGSVIVTLSGASEPIAITNNSGSSLRVFGTNGIFTFLFSDSSGNSGSVLATVANIDTTPPVITLLGTSPISVTQNTPYSDMGVMATDNLSGNITGLVTVSGSVNTSLTGSYTLMYSVLDSVGNIAVPVSRVVNVVGVPVVVTIPNTGAGGGGGSPAFSPIQTATPLTFYSAPINSTNTVESDMTL